MSTLTIKNLSIAMEAISRINSYAAVARLDELNDLLEAEIKREKEYHKTETTHTHKTDNDDIPF